MSKQVKTDVIVGILSDASVNRTASLLNFLFQIFSFLFFSQYDFSNACNRVLNIKFVILKVKKSMLELVSYLNFHGKVILLSLMC